ncbi:hypothetical protein ABTM04_20285, partial [Acinetobacter baumannii]
RVLVLASELVVRGQADVGGELGAGQHWKGCQKRSGKHFGIREGHEIDLAKTSEGLSVKKRAYKVRKECSYIRKCCRDPTEAKVRRLPAATH